MVGPPSHLGGTSSNGRPRGPLNTSVVPFPPPAPRDPAGWQLLVVEDDVWIARLIDRIVMRSGSTVHIVGTVAAALSELGEERWTALVTDLSLPDGSGIEVIEHAREVAPKLPILATSAYGAVAESQALEIGASAFLAKPFTPVGLWNAIEQVVRSTSGNAET